MDKSIGNEPYPAESGGERGKCQVGSFDPSSSSVRVAINNSILTLRSPDPDVRLEYTPT